MFREEGVTEFYLVIGYGLLFFSVTGVNLLVESARVLKITTVTLSSKTKIKIYHYRKCNVCLSNTYLG